MVRSSLIFLGFFVCFGQAHAQDADPFSGLGEWQTVEEFTKKKQAEADSAASGEQAPAAAAQVSGQTPSDPNAPKPEGNERVAQKEEKPAEPPRPVNYPVMPAASHHARADRTLVISSTVDANVDLLAPEEEEAEEPKWQNIEERDAEIAKADEAERLASILDRSPFKIRFATLPSNDVKSIPGQRISGSRYDMQKKYAAKKDDDDDTSPEIKKKKTKTASSSKKLEPDICETLIDMRRRQLDAIESDRKTLALLRSALADLGLTEKLSFMTDSDVLREPKTPVTTSN